MVNNDVGYQVKASDGVHLAVLLRILDQHDYNPSSVDRDKFIFTIKYRIRHFTAMAIINNGGIFNPPWVG